MNETCEHTTHRYGEGEIRCERPAGHPGNCWHAAGGPGQTYGVIFSRGFSVSAAADYVPCDKCGTMHRPDGECLFCETHEAWLAAYERGEVIVANGRAMKRTRASGAFGNAQITVTMNDGRVFGPDSKTWDLGDIPHEYRDRMPDNAVLTWGR